MAKYDPIKNHLIRSFPRELAMTFAEIEAVLGAPLPKSARRPRFWADPADSPGHGQRRAWTEAGYQASVMPPGDRVKFAPSAPLQVVAEQQALPVSPPVSRAPSRPAWRRRLEVAVLLLELVGLPAALIGLYLSFEQIRQANQSISDGARQIEIATTQTNIALQSLERDRESDQRALVADARATLYDPGVDPRLRVAALGDLINSGVVIGDDVALDCPFVFQDIEKCATINGLTINPASSVRVDAKVSALGLTLHASTVRNLRVKHLDMMDGNILGGTWRNVVLDQADFVDAYFWGVDFGNTVFGAGHWVGADVAGADLSEVTFKLADISGLLLCADDLHGTDATRRDLGCANVSATAFDYAYFFQSNPPRGIDLFLTQPGIWECAGAEGDEYFFVDDDPRDYLTRECFELAKEGQRAQFLAYEPQ